MQTITLRGKVGADGVLHLAIPHLPVDEEMEAVVQLRSHSNNPLIPLADLAGIIDDETFVEPEDLPLQPREAIE